MAGVDEPDVANVRAAGPTKLGSVIRSLAAQSQAQTEFLKAIKEDQVLQDKTTQADMAEKVKQLAAQARAQTRLLKAMKEEQSDFLEAMKKNQARHNKTVLLQAACALANNGVGSFLYRKASSPDEDVSSSGLVCDILLAFISHDTCGFAISTE